MSLADFDFVNVFECTCCDQIIHNCLVLVKPYANEVFRYDIITFISFNIVFVIHKKINKIYRINMIIFSCYLTPNMQ